MEGSWIRLIVVVSLGIVITDCTTVMLGYGPVEREKKDLWSKSMIITDPLQQLLVFGKVTGWQYYAVNTDPVYLQVWRLTITSGLNYYTLAGGTKVTPKATGYNEVTLSTSEQFAVQYGDVLGLTFENKNPIPYSKRLDCGEFNMHLYARDNITTTAGVKLLPVSGVNQWEPCKYYSFRAMVSCTSSGNDTCYEEFVQEQCRMANPVVPDGTGQLSSHSARYETYYAAGQQCGVVLSVPEGSRIRIDFTKFELKGNCDVKVDHLKIYEGSDNTGKELAFLCGTSIPSAVYSCTNKAYLYFYTSTVGSGGFTLNYASEALDAACGTDYTVLIVAIVCVLVVILIIVAVVLGVKYYKKRKQLSKDRRPLSVSEKISRKLAPKPYEEYSGPVLMVAAPDYYNRPPAYTPMGGADAMEKAVSR